MNVTDIFQATISFFTNQDLLLKVILIILVSLYGLFSIVIMTQIKRLNEIVNQISFSGIFKFLAYFHTAASFALLLFIIFAL